MNRSGAAPVHRDRRHVAGDPDRVVGLGDQRPGFGVEHGDRAEAVRRRAGRVPAGQAPAGVDVLAHQQVGGADRARAARSSRASVATTCREPSAKSTTSWARKAGASP